MNFLKNIADKAKSATESPTRTNATRNSSTGNFKTGVADPWHVGTNPNPRIRTSD